MPAPMLDLSNKALSVQNAIEDTEERNAVLAQLIDGRSMLSIAQELKLTEKQVQSYLNEALALQTEYMRENADTLQQVFFLQHQEMYEIAKRAALSVDAVGIKAGRDVYWFREMRTSLQAQEAILNKYMNKKDDGPKTLNLTVVENTPLARLAQRLLEQGLADETITITGS